MARHAFPSAQTVDESDLHQAQVYQYRPGPIRPIRPSSNRCDAKSLANQQDRSRRIRGSRRLPARASGKIQCAASPEKQRIAASRLPPDNSARFAGIVPERRIQRGGGGGGFGGGDCPRARPKPLPATVYILEKSVGHECGKELQLADSDPSRPALAMAALLKFLGRSQGRRPRDHRGEHSATRRAGDQPQSHPFGGPGSVGVGGGGVAVTAASGR